MCIHMVDSLCHTAETDTVYKTTILQFLKNRKKVQVNKSWSQDSQADCLLKELNNQLTKYK